MHSLTVAIFPGAGSAHLYHAVDDGRFSDGGLDVDLYEVTSSQEQIDGWNDGRFDVMHTSPDHLLRGASGRDAVIVRAEAIGELSVYLRAAVNVSEARWAVDGVESAFALVLRSVIADVAGADATRARLVAVGGTPQRAAALIDGVADGAVLHPPFNRSVAGAGGYECVGSHLDVIPKLMTVGCIVPRAEARSDPIRRYVEICNQSAVELTAGGPASVAAALEARKWPAPIAAVAAADVVGVTGLAADPRPRVEQLEAALALRERWFGPIGRSQSLDSLIELP